MNQDGEWSGWESFVAQVEALLEEEEEPMLDPKDANNIIRFLSAAYMATTDPQARAEFNRLANELRRASGQEPQPG